MGSVRNAYGVQDYFEETGVDGRITLNWMLNK
jgi:hypothetical protein